jgi:DNA-binding GntR family transcriptional regulator
MQKTINNQESTSKSSSDEAYLRIRQDILEGEFDLGQRLIETDLGERYNMSRTPIREALHRLQAEGLVEIDRGRGAQVRLYSKKDLEEIYGIRSILESYAARIATSLISSDTIAQLISICDQMEAIPIDDHRKETIRALVVMNNTFHRLIWDATDNDRLVTHLRHLTELPLVYKSYFWHTQAERARSLRYHREMVAAFQYQDAKWAEALMRCHVFAAQNYLLGVLSQKDEDNLLDERITMFNEADA